jgi:O-antigen/teichoic acid export membrane protein
MSKKFASSVILLILVNVLVKFLWIFGVERGIQLQVGFQNYGLYYSLFNFTFILSIITDGGLSNYLVTSIAQQKNQDTFLLKIILSFLYILTALGIGYLFGYSQSYFTLLLILSIYQMLWSFLTYLRGFLKGNQFFNAEVFFSIFDKVLLILLFIPLLYFKEFRTIDIIFFAKMQVIAVLLSLIMCTIVLAKNNIYIFSNIGFNPKLSILKEIAPFTLFTFLVLAYNKIDSVMLETMLINGQQESGIYAAAYRLLDASNLLPILFASLFLPAISKNLLQKKEISQLTKLSFDALMSMSIILSMACWYYKLELMNLLYGTKNSEYLAFIFGILMFSSPLIVLYYIFSTILTAQNKLKVLNLIAGFGLLLNILLNLYLIPHYQALGAAISTLIALTLIGFAYTYFCYRNIKSVIQLQQISKLIGLSAMLCLSGYGLQQIEINWIIEIAIFLNLALFYIFMLKLVRIKSLSNFLK